MAILAVPVVVRAQAGVPLRGRIVSVDGMPVAGATVTIAALGYSVTSDSTGRFTLGGSAGSTLRLGVAAAGYRSDTASIVLPRRRFVERDFTLVDDDAPLPEANPSDRMLSGRVTDPQGTPLAYANIQLNGGRRFVSDDSGRFRIPINTDGGFTLLVRRIGVEAAEVKLAAMPDTVVPVRLVPAAVSLPETRVTAAPFQSLDLHGFYARMADVERGVNRGYVITPEELELRKPHIVTSAVEAVPGIRIGVIQPDGARVLPLQRNFRIEDWEAWPVASATRLLRYSRPSRRCGRIAMPNLSRIQRARSRRLAGVTGVFSMVSWRMCLSSARSATGGGTSR